MMYCHVCDEDVPLGDIVNHVRLFHPDAYPIAEKVEVHFTLPGPEIEAAVRKVINRDGLGPSWIRR